MLCAFPANFFVLDGLILRLFEIAFANRIAVCVRMMAGKYFARVFASGIYRSRTFLIQSLACLSHFSQPFLCQLVADETGTVFARQFVIRLRQVQLKSLNLFFSLHVRDMCRFSETRSCWRWTLLALFILPEVVTNRSANFLQSPLADAGNLFQLLRRHIRQCLDSGDASGNQFLNDRFAQLPNLFDRRRRTARHRLHLLLDFLTLFLFALDVDLPGKQLGRKPYVLTFLT